jgi:receptor expression-enhancing protein 1/2/3/4
LALRLQLISSVASFVFPVLASYRALEHNDPTLIRVWLIYWVVIALQITVEAYAGVLLTNLPLFYFTRFLFTLWLVLPQFQGASQIYALYVRPFLSNHEQDIDKLVTQAHDKIKALGGEYVAAIIELLQNQVALVLGIKTDNKRFTESDNGEMDVSGAGSSQPGSSDRPAQSYADMLFSKFKTPPTLSLPEGYTLGALLSPLATKSPASYLASLMGSSAQAGNVALPSSLRTKADKLTYIKEQKLKLMELITSLDEHTKAIENEDEPADTDYDLVKKDEAEDDKIHAKEGLPQEDTSAEDAKGWFSWR